MAYRKKLIEVALPLEAINKASAREKSIRHGHPSTLHLWWARRPLAACRAVIFTSLVDDPDDPEAPPKFVEACKQLPSGKNAAANDTPRQRLFDFIELLVQWKSTTDEAVIEKARELIRLSTDGSPPPLLDPFAGGGSIPLEAQRLGLEAHASDLNPVAVMINKALIEIPPKFAELPPVNPRDRTGTAAGSSWKGAAGLAVDVRYYGEWMREKAWERIGHLYPKSVNKETVVGWIWARTVKSPNPVINKHVPLISNYWLSKRKNDMTWVEPIVHKNDQKYRFEIRKGQPPVIDKTNKGTKAGRAEFNCLLSNALISGKYIDSEASLGRMSVFPVAMVVKTKSGRDYRTFDENQVNIAINEAGEYLEENYIDEIPSEPARGTFGSNNAQGRIYGFNTFKDYFTSRQLVALMTLSKLVDEAVSYAYQHALETGMLNDSRLLADGGVGAIAYAQAIGTYLGMAVSRLADIQNSLCMWENSRAQIRHVFTRHAIPMLWDFAEGNIFSGAAGDFLVTLSSMIRVIEKLPNNVLAGKAFQADSRDLNPEHSYIASTDPPYYDNIEYSDLGDFFYVWLRRTVGNIFPDLFKTILTPKSAELVANAYRFEGNLSEANAFFENGLKLSFEKLHKIKNTQAPLSIFYAFKQTEITTDDGESSGWETMLSGLLESGFSIVGTWPFRTELKNRMIASGRNALASSIILVCRPRSTNAPMTSRREFVNALRRELPASLREMQSGNIAPVDLAQASIGPGMAVYSRYTKVLEPDGSPLTVRAALQIINHELDAYLAEQEGEMDPDSRFAVSWFEQFGFDEGGFGQADVLARAKNTSVDGLASAGVLESGVGKVRLLGWQELDPGWDPESDTRLTVWETVHHLIERLNSHGEEGAARLLAKLSPEIATDTRQLAYRLYSICERKKWAEHARDYNALVVSWGASQEQAREFKEQYQQGTMF